MLQRSCSPFGLPLIAAVLLVLVLLMPGAGGETTPVPAPNETVQPAPSYTTDFPGLNTTFVPLTLPPRITLTRTDIEQDTSSVYGTATPGSITTTITTLLWDWGDNSTPEYHDFPHSHTYRGPGIYTLSVTAFQSDGQKTTEERTIRITRSIIPEITVGIIPTQAPGPGVVTGAPVLTLLEPVVDGMNVTVNGNLNPGGPGVTIASVMVDWGDGTRTNSADLPVTYHYAAPGIYTITLTGEQSDGQSATKGITVDIRAELPGPPEPASSAPPPGDQTVFLIVIATAFVVAAAVAISQIFLSRRRDVSPSADIPEPIAEQEEIYYKAKQNGDMAAAAASARVCTRMFRSLAEESPGRRLVYLEMADAWEMKARNAERTGKPPQKIGSITENLPSPEDLQRICSGTDVTPEVALAVIRVAMEIAREGREGKAVGTSFVVGDTGAVLDNSRQFVLNPFHGYREDERQITDIGIRGNIKEFAQLDGAFVVSGPGVVEAAGRYITVDMSRVKIPGGLGSRHSSIAGITQATNSIGIVVSQSGGLISVFRKGKIVYTIGS